jgi:hypothetical protein
MVFDGAIGVTDPNLIDRDHAMALSAIAEAATQAATLTAADAERLRLARESDVPILGLNYKDKAAIVGEKGVSLHNKVDGALALEAKKYKRATPVRINGNMIFGNSLALRNTDGDYAVYNLDSGVFNKYDGRTNAQAILSDDGSSLYVFESGNMMRKSKVTKFATR